MQKSQSMQHLNQSPLLPLCSTSLLQQDKKNIKDIFKGGTINEMMRLLISKFFIYESVAQQKANSHHFKNMIIDAQQVGNY